MNEPKPDGYIVMTLRRPLWPELPKNEDGYYEFKVLFMEMDYWHQDTTGVLIRYPNDGRGSSFVRIPWSNILGLEWQDNSDEVAEQVAKASPVLTKLLSWTDKERITCSICVNVNATKECKG